MHSAMGSRISKLGLPAVRAALAVVHCFPARKHLAALVAARHLADVASEAWKGLGAAAIVAVLLAPRPLSRPLIRLTIGSSERRPTHAALLVLLLAVAHFVPAEDHLPRFLAAPTWPDAWRGVGAAFAVALFSLLAISWSRGGLRRVAGVVSLSSFR